MRKLIADIRELLKRIFPAMTHFGPAGNADEVNGLPKDTYPANCEILMSGQDASLKGRREYFLVRIEGVVLWLRICKAMPGCGYDEFAVIHRVAMSEQEQRDAREYAEKFIECTCERRTLN